MEVPQKPWEKPSKEILSELETTENGISDFEAQKRILHYGSNSISHKEPVPIIQIFFDQFVDLLVVMLLLAAILSFLLKDFHNGVIISAIVFLNALIGFTQEYKVERILRALTRYLPEIVKVRRNGIEKEIPAQYLVPGDIVILGEGNKVPADIRLLETYDFTTNDQALTGEAVPQKKEARDYPNDDLTLVEVENCVFMGTVVASGEASGVVVRTGVSTEFGKIAKKTAEIDKTHSPLQEKTHSLAKRIAIFAAFVVIALVVYKYFYDHQLYDAIIFAIAVAAALVPEGLPASVSIALSISARNLAKNKALVKNLVSVETLGSVTVICSDKTGTITTGQMEVKEIWDEINSEINPAEKNRLIYEALTLCNDAEINESGEIGDSTELALLRWVKSKNIDYQKIRNKYHKLNEIPFNSARRFMASTYQSFNRQFTYLKGAPEIVMEKCHLDEKEEKAINNKISEYASNGERVLALGYNNIFLGLVAIYDPPRKEIAEAIDDCQRAHIKVIMVTGDNPKTATSIAKKVGILRENDSDSAIEGSMLDRVNDLELRNLLQKEKVFARILPEQKYRIVKNLIEMGEIVAVTGDGVNDAPALKKADIGVAMGVNGTDVSREAADMILLDDNFATIVKAVKEGRIIFDNIRKFVFFIFSHNFGELSIVLLGIVFGLPLPLLAVQILAVDLGSDILPSLAMIAEKDEEVMQTNPRSKLTQLLNNQDLIQITIISLITGFGAIWNFTSVLQSTGNYAAATSISFATLVVCQIFNAFIARCPNTPIMKYPLSNRYLLGAIVVSIAIILLFIYTNFFNQFLSTDHFPAIYWLRAIVVGIMFTIGSELYKYIRLYRAKSL